MKTPKGWLSPLRESLSAATGKAEQGRPVKTGEVVRESGKPSIVQFRLWSA